MSFYKAGQTLLTQHCLHLSACTDTRRIHVQFAFELSSAEMAAVRDYMVDQFSGEAHDIAFAGACHVPPVMPTGFSDRFTRMVFAVREKALRQPEAVTETLGGLFTDSALQTRLAGARASAAAGRA